MVEREKIRHILPRIPGIENTLLNMRILTYMLCKKIYEANNWSAFTKMLPKQSPDKATIWILSFNQQLALAVVSEKITFSLLFWSLLGRWWAIGVQIRASSVLQTRTCLPAAPGRVPPQLQFQAQGSSGSWHCTCHRGRRRWRNRVPKTRWSRKPYWREKSTRW